MKKSSQTPPPWVADADESMCDPDTHIAVRAVIDPDPDTPIADLDKDPAPDTHSAAMRLWRQAANNDFNDDVVQFLSYVARAIVKADNAKEITPEIIKNACGLYGRKQSRLDGTADNFLEVYAMFDVIGDDGNPTPGPPPLPSVAEVVRAIESHPEAHKIRNDKKQSAAKKALWKDRKKTKKSKFSILCSGKSG